MSGAENTAAQIPLAPICSRGRSAQQHGLGGVAGVGAMGGVGGYHWGGGGGGPGPESIYIHIYIYIYISLSLSILYIYMAHFSTSKKAARACIVRPEYWRYAAASSE